MGYRLYVEQEAAESLEELAQRYGHAVRPASKVANVVPGVRNFLLEVADGDHNDESDAILAGGRARLYRVPQDWFGRGRPQLEVHVVVAGTTATVLSVTEPPSRSAPTGSGDPSTDHAEAVAQRLVRNEDDNARQDD